MSVRSLAALGVAALEVAALEVAALEVPGLLLVAHGSRDRRFVPVAERVRSATAAALPGVVVELAYLDLNAPLAGERLADLAGSHRFLVVVPLLLGEGYHSRFDLPAIIAGISRGHPGVAITQTPVVGATSMVPALADRLVCAGVTATDGVVMCAVGSSDEGSDETAGDRGVELSARLGVPVATVFATKLGPDDRRLHEAVAAVRRAGAQRIAFSPYLLSPGLLGERVLARLLAAEPTALIAAPITDHPVLIETIAARYAAAIVDQTQPSCGTLVARA